MQLTGIRIPDPKIQQTHTADDLVRHLMVPAKPPKLAAVLKEKADDGLSALPNVHLHDRRWRPMDREKEIGREKLIREELTRRNLPFNMKHVKQVKP